MTRPSSISTHKGPGKDLALWLQTLDVICSLPGQMVPQECNASSAG